LTPDESGLNRAGGASDRQNGDSIRNQYANRKTESLHSFRMLLGYFFSTLRISRSRFPCLTVAAKAHLIMLFT
jgi:hypothetical protein